MSVQVHRHVSDVLQQRQYIYLIHIESVWIKKKQKKTGSAVSCLCGCTGCVCQLHQSHILPPLGDNGGFSHGVGWLSKYRCLSLVSGTHPCEGGGMRRMGGRVLPCCSCTGNIMNMEMCTKFRNIQRGAKEKQFMTFSVSC